MKAREQGTGDRMQDVSVECRVWSVENRWRTAFDPHPVQHSILNTQHSILNTQHSLLITSLLLVALFLCAQLALAVEPNVAESWADGTARGWNRRDVLNSQVLKTAVAAGSLEVSFPLQSTMPYPQVELLAADSGASGGAFAGDYLAAGVDRIELRASCEGAVPGLLEVVLTTGSGRRWFLPLTGAVTGTWSELRAAVDFDAGWKAGAGGTREQFLADLRDVAMLGVRVQRGGTTAKHVFRLDDVRLNGRSALQDTDGDGLPDTWELLHDMSPQDVRDRFADDDADGISNYGEYRAGTDPRNRRSRLAMRIRKQDEQKTKGVKVEWESNAGGTYRVRRMTNDSNGFQLMQSGIAATPPVNAWFDSSATGNGPYLYRVEVE